MFPASQSSSSISSVEPRDPGNQQPVSSVFVRNNGTVNIGPCSFDKATSSLLEAPLEEVENTAKLYPYSLDDTRLLPINQSFYAAPTAALL